MKRSMCFLGGVLVLAAVLALPTSSSQAGRSGGPLSTFSTAPPGTCIPFDLTFDGGKAAVITVESDANADMDVRLTDRDGHCAIGTGPAHRKTVTMNVQHRGMLRVEVRNLGAQRMIFTLTTN